MEENTDKAIVLNTFIMYVRLFVVSICGLFTTRFALQALGQTDFGLFSLLGGVIMFVSLLNTIMISTSNRFIATAIGKQNNKLVNETFNVNLIIHFAIACITLIISFPIGDWYILHYVNFDGDINTAVTVFNITVIGAVIAFVSVPYNGLMMAKERFLVFCLVDIISCLLKMLGALSLNCFTHNKIIVYAFFISILSAFPTFVYAIYCRKHFKDYTKIRFVRKSKLYREVLSFSVWIGYGAFATLAKNQGAALVINNFFNTVMNTALGIANSISLVIQQVAFNIGKSMTPQITKSYAAGNIDRAETLTIACSKYTFLLLLITATPFLVEPDFLISFWLGNVPTYAPFFTRLLIIDALVISLNAGIPELIFASGKIKWYQLIVNTLLICSVIVGFYVLQLGKPAYYLQVVYIIFSVIILVVRQFVLNMVVKFNSWKLIKKSYLPCFTVVLLFLPYFLLDITSPIINIFAATIYVFIIIYVIGLRKYERDYIHSHNPFRKNKTKRDI